MSDLPLNQYSPIPPHSNRDDPDNQKEIEESSNEVELKNEGLTRTIIIELVLCYQSGNYLPLLHCYKNNLIPLEFLDESGYHPLHSAISSYLFPPIIIMLDHFKIDVNIHSKYAQTPLMIASNYGFHEICKLLCERGARINEQEDTQFSALTYSVKHGHIAVFAYLLSPECRY